MASVKRQTFIAMSLVSLLLCAQACIMWARSQHIYEYRRWDRGDARNRIGSARGYIYYEWLSPPTVLRAKWSNRLILADDPPIYPVSTWSLLGFAISHGRSGAYGWFDVRIPYWAIASATGISAIILLRRTRRRRHLAGACPLCGYDLRATPDRCPECGTEMKDPVARDSCMANQYGTIMS